MSNILTDAIDTAAPAQDTVAPNAGEQTNEVQTEQAAPQQTETKTEAKPAEDLIFGKYKNMEEAQKGFKELEKEMGSRVKIPGEDATPDDWAKFYAKLGRPDTPDAYEIPVPEDKPAEAAFFKGMAAKAHELGFTKAQMQGIMEWGNAIGADYNAAREAEWAEYHKQSEKMMMSKWGTDYKDNVFLAATTGVKLLGDENFKRLMNSNGLGSHPEVIEMFYRLGTQVSEGSIPERAKPAGMTKEDAVAQRLAIMNDKSNPLYEAYRKPMHKDHETAKKKIDELTRIAFPS